jgi:hypothetical protein
VGKWLTSRRTCIILGEKIPVLIDGVDPHASFDVLEKSAIELSFV